MDAVDDQEKQQNVNVGRAMNFFKDPQTLFLEATRQGKIQSFSELLWFNQRFYV